MNYVVYLIFRFFILLFSIMPFPLIYGFSNFLAFMIGKVFKYRFAVINQNLINSFPGISEKERKRIIKLTYRNITDLLVESIKSFTMSEKQIRKREIVLNPEILDQIFANGSGVIGNTGHYGNWEWAALTASFYLKHKPVGFYKPLSNKYLDKYLKNNRGRFGMQLCSIKITAKLFEEYKNRTAFFAMVGDQSPSRVSQAYWFDFLNQKTACIHGPEKYAKLYNLPIVFLDIQRIRRGYYTVEISMISEDPAKMPEGEITRIYMKKLEEVIRKKPENWLWSHRRWKIKPNEKSIIRN